MKKIYLIIISIIFTLTLKGEEYGVLTASDESNSEILTISKGDYIQTLSYHSKDNANGVARIKYRIDSNSSWILYPDETRDFDGLQRYFLEGDYQLQYNSIYSGHFSEMSYKIVRGNEFNYTNSNIINVGAGNGDKTLVIETSNDLSNWNQIFSSAVNQDYQLFRIRLAE